MRIVEIDYGQYIDLDDIEFVADEDLQRYVEQIVDEQAIYGKKVA